MLKRETVSKVMVLMLAFFALLPIIFTGRTVCALERTPIAYSATTEGNNGGGDDSGDIGNLNITMGENGDSISIEGLDTDDDTWTTIFKKYKKIILGFSGIATLTFVAFFIKNFLSVGANSDNPQARSSAIKGCLWTGIATAACGSIMIIVGLFWNALK